MTVSLSAGDQNRKGTRFLLAEARRDLAAVRLPSAIPGQPGRVAGCGRGCGPRHRAGPRTARSSGLRHPAEPASQ
jgi:hypothetical protein